MTSPPARRRTLSLRRGFTLLEMFLVLLISGILVAAIAAAINIHLRVSEVGRSEVEQAQLARALLRRIADDLRGAVPNVKPVESEAGATADEVASAAASAASGANGMGGSAGGASSSGSGGASGSTGGGSSSGGSSGSGTQTLQPLKTLSTLKPQSASSSASGSAGNSSSSASGGSAASGSSAADKTAAGSTTNAESSDESSTTVKPPGIYGDRFTLEIDVSRIPRAGLIAPSAAPLDAPGDIKTVGYYLAPITGATDMTGLPTMGLYRRSFDKAAVNFDAAVAAEPQLLAAEVAAIEFRYFDGTAWQTSWDSSGGTLPTAVEILMTLHPPHTARVSSSPALTLPQHYRLTVAIPAAQAAAATSTDASTESSTSSSETTP